MSTPHDVAYLPNAKVFKCYAKHPKGLPQKFSFKVGTMHKSRKARTIGLITGGTGGKVGVQGMLEGGGKVRVRRRMILPMIAITKSIAKKIKSD